MHCLERTLKGFILQKMNIFDTIGISAVLWCAIISTLLFKLTRRDPRISKFLKQIPGPPDIPLFGNLLILTEASTNYAAYKLPLRLAKKYGPVFRLWFGKKPYVILSTASQCEKLLTSYAHVEKSDDYNFLKPWILEGLFLASPAKWHSRRKLLTPAFHFKILEQFTAIFNEKGNRLASLLAQQTNKHFNIAPFITRCALDIICETAMGVRVEAQENSDNPELKEYVDTTYKLDALITKKMLQPLYWIESLYNLTSLAKEEKKCLDIVHTFTSKVIQERRLERQKCGVIDSPILNNITSTKKRQAFLDLVMDATEHDPNFTDADVREETEAFMVAGHETTATSVLWAIFLLAAHPQYQKRVQDEIESVSGTRNAELAFSDIPKLVFLDACIKESLRLFPPGTVTIRKVGEDITLEDGKVIPKGVTAAVLLTAVQRDPKYFPDPDVFNPHRFLNDSSSKLTTRHPLAFIPFSAGPRNCIGQKFSMYEMKVLLAKIFTNFDVQTQETLQTIRPCAHLILRPEGGNLFVTLTPRA